MTWFFLHVYTVVIGWINREIRETNRYLLFANLLGALFYLSSCGNKNEFTEKVHDPNKPIDLTSFYPKNIRKIIEKQFLPDKTIAWLVSYTDESCT